MACTIATTLSTRGTRGDFLRDGRSQTHACCQFLWILYLPMTLLAAIQEALSLTKKGKWWDSFSMATWKASRADTSTTMCTTARYQYILGASTVRSNTSTNQKELRQKC